MKATTGHMLESDQITIATGVFQEIWQDFKKAKYITFKQYALETDQISRIQKKIKQMRQSLVKFLSSTRESSLHMSVSTCRRLMVYSFTTGS